MMVRNRIRKGIISLVLAFVFCMNYSILSFAAEISSETSNNTASIHMLREDMSSGQIELYEKLMSQDELQVGDVIILSQTEDEILYAEVTGSSKMTRGAEVSSKTFVLTRSILGFTQRMFSMTVVCNWISDGVNSKITSFVGSYEILASGVSCAWNSDFERKEDIWHSLCLDFSYGTTTGYVFAGAMIHGSVFEGDPVSLVITFDPH